MTVLAREKLLAAPELPDEAVAALPRRHPRALCHLVAALAVPPVAYFWVDRDVPESLLSADLAHLAINELPLLLALPVMRRVGMTPFFWLLGVMVIPFGGAVLAWKVAFRLVALPYRDWMPRVVDAPRIRNVRRHRAYVLVDSPAAGHGWAEPILRPAHRRAIRYVEVVTRWGWLAVPPAVVAVRTDPEGAGALITMSLLLGLILSAMAATAWVHHRVYYRVYPIGFRVR